MEEILERSVGTVLANSLISVVFIVAVIGLRMLVLRNVLHREEMTHEARRRWVVNSRNAVLMVLVVGLVFIWTNELFTLAVSLVAIAAALVIATKELILCFSGAVLRAGSKAFSLCIPAPARRQSRIEQAILRRFLASWGEYKSQVRPAG